MTTVQLSVTQILILITPILLGAGDMDQLLKETFVSLEYYFLTI